MTDLPALSLRIGKEQFSASLSWNFEETFDQDVEQDSIDRAKEDERFRRIQESD